jgi:hypothetical protein
LVYNRGLRSFRRIHCEYHYLMLTKKKTKFYSIKLMSNEYNNCISS